MAVTSDLLYFPTYTRIGCYFVGVATGYYLSKTERVWNVSKVITNLHLIVFEFHFLLWLDLINNLNI